MSARSGSEITLRNQTKHQVLEGDIMVFVRGTQGIKGLSTIIWGKYNGGFIQRLLWEHCERSVSWAWGWFKLKKDLICLSGQLRILSAASASESMREGVTSSLQCRDRKGSSDLSKGELCVSMGNMGEIEE